MKRTLISLLACAAFALTVKDRVAAAPGTAAPRADRVRTVYVSALDANGAQVTDLTAADLAVKEGGKDRPIDGLRPAATPMQIAIFVDDGGTGAYQGAVAQFFDATLGRAQFAVSIMNPQPIKVVDYTADIGALRGVIGRLGQRGRVVIDGEQIVEAVSGAARELQQLRAPRPVILVLTVSGETALSPLADSALSNLRTSGASLHVLYITGNDLGKVLGDGPRQSGGMIQQASPGVQLGPVLASIADNLMHQYALTYTIPDGVKLSDKISVTTTRKGVKLLAPSRLPDK